MHFWFARHRQGNSKLTKHFAALHAFSRVERVLLAAGQQFDERFVKRHLAVDAKAVINTARLSLDVVQIAEVFGAVANHVADALCIFARIRRFVNVPTYKASPQ